MNRLNRAEKEICLELGSCISAIVALLVAKEIITMEEYQKIVDISREIGNKKLEELND